MRLREDGETCTIGFHETIDQWYNEFNRYTKLNKEDRLVIHNVLGQMYDDYLTSKLIWAQQPKARPLEDYLDMLDGIAEYHPQPMEILDKTYLDIEKLMDQYLTLPTWRVVYAKFRRGYLYLELGEDFRVIEYMKEHGHEYEGR